MARYKPYDYCQTQLLPVSLEHQLLQGTLEHTIHVLVDHHMDFSLVEDRSNNEKAGCPAYDPKILLQVVLFAYSRGIIGSRRVEWLCRNHVIWMALACMQHPDHSPIAAFVSSMQAELLSLFCDVLLVCEEQQLLGGTVFALDGLNLPSNTLKAWSGTIEELQHTPEKLEANLAQLLDDHQQVDAEEREGGFRAATPTDERPEGAACSSEETPCEQELSDTSPTPPSAEPAVISPEDPCQDDQRDASQPQERQRPVAERPTDSPTWSKTAHQRQKTRAQKTLEHQRTEREARDRRHITRLEEWLATHDKNIGRRGTEIKSTVIDNDSARMATSHGVIQGANAQALVDDTHQIIVVAEAFGDGQDA